MVAVDPILREIRSRLEHLYGDRLTRVVLYGSRARGDAQSDSDYDAAVFLRDLRDRWTEFGRLNPEWTSMLYERGAFIQAIPFSGIPLRGMLATHDRDQARWRRAMNALWPYPTDPQAR